MFESLTVIQQLTPPSWPPKLTSAYIPYGARARDNPTNISTYKN
jgi:hypothetical protein